LLLSFFYLRRLDFKRDLFDLGSVKKFVNGLVPSMLLNRLRHQVELVYMGLFIANWELGFYYLADKITSYLLAAPKDALSQVLLPYNIERSNSSETIGRFASLSIKFSVLFTVVAGLAITALAGPALALFFPDFSNAFYLFPFLILLYIVMEDAPLSTVFKSLNRMDLVARAELVSLAVGVVLGLVLISAMQAVGFILSRVVVFLAKMLIMLYYLRGMKIRVEIIPRFRDLKYFYSSFRSLLP